MIMKADNKNLLLRVLVALVFGPAVIYCLYSGGIPLLIFLMIASFGLITEFCLLPRVRCGPFRGGLLLAAGLGLPIIYYAGRGDIAAEFVISASAVWLLLELLRGEFGGTLERAAFGPFALIFFAWGPAFSFELGRISPLYAVLPMALVWVGDSAAYFGGKAFGRRKMTPLLSPHKTWAGFGGEIVGAMATALVFRLVWPDVFGWDILFFAAPAGVLAVLGDLFESKAKREMKIKDSSHVIPGHGGFWDRFDSWLFVQLWAWIYFVVL